MPETIPSCPRCGSPMKLRTARKGPSAGRPFWGCSRYPDCKGIVNIDDAAPGTSSEPGMSPTTTSSEPLALGTFPRTVVASPPTRFSQTVFYQACSLPESHVRALHEDDSERYLQLAISHWRLDFPFPRNPALPEDVRTALAVAESLLTRGAITLCSPAIEALIDDPPCDVHLSSSFADRMLSVARKPSCPFIPTQFDSQEEESLYNWLLRTMDEKGAFWHVIPQIHLASLCPDINPNAKQRGDFLLVQPGVLKPILVEVDGAQHQAHAEGDAERDRRLTAAGVRVIRVPVNELRLESGPHLDLLNESLDDGVTNIVREDDACRVIRQARFAHQTELALLQAIRGGWLSWEGSWRVGIVLPPMLAKYERSDEIARAAVQDLLALLVRLCRLYDEPPPGVTLQVSVADPAQLDGYDIVVAPSDSIHDLSSLAQGVFMISDTCFPGEVAAPQSAAAPKTAESPSREDARWFLNYLFRKEDFLEGQWETIWRTLRGQDSVVLLPTGAGKSIAFQLAALLLPGRCLVVDPIISLIDDQIDNLAAVGIDRCIGITSQLSTLEREEALRCFASGDYLFCYVAPERFQTESFRVALRTLTVSTPISIIAIDEAHCVSEWGHQFRTAYLNLGRTTRKYCESQGRVPPLVALTGTASRIVLKDVQRELGITDIEAIITPFTFDRKELHFDVLSCHSREKTARVEGYILRLPTDFGVTRSSFFSVNGDDTHAGLVFCPHVNGEYGVVRQAEHLGEALRIPVAHYSGTSPKGMGLSAADKQDTAKSFKHNKLALMACTKAFGMGIDKPNIRYTVHIGLPESIEAFYQEAGRAGRNRQPAHCAIIVSNDDPKRTVRLLSPATDLDEIVRTVADTKFQDNDDIMRSLWFHVNSFRGQREELTDIEGLLDKLGDVRAKQNLSLSWQQFTSGRGERNQARERVEKAIHRLVVIGVIEDYTIDYASSEFGITLSAASQEEIAQALGAYAGSYQRALGESEESACLSLRSPDHRRYIVAVAECLIAFTYKHIEQARRRSLNEMLLTATNFRNEDDFRQRILDYLGKSEFDAQLDEVIASAAGGIDALTPILDNVISPVDAASLRGSTARLLTSYPDVPGLLLLRAVSEILAHDGEREVAEENLKAALDFGLTRYALTPTALARACGEIISTAASKAGASEILLRTCLASPACGRDFVRDLMRSIPYGLATLTLDWLTAHLDSRLVTLLNTQGAN